jgi:hypothetical protein
MAPAGHTAAAIDSAAMPRNTDFIEVSLLGVASQPGATRSDHCRGLRALGQSRRSAGADT